MLSTLRFVGALHSPADPIAVMGTIWLLRSVDNYQVEVLLTLAAVKRLAYVHNAAT